MKNYLVSVLVNEYRFKFSVQTHHRNYLDSKESTTTNALKLAKERFVA